MLRPLTYAARAPIRVVRPSVYRPVAVRGIKFEPETGPSPPRLPKEEQEEFERLQRAANTQEAIELSEEEIELLKQGKLDLSARRQEVGTHPEYRKPYADFEGDVNPETGEVGGPKQDPLRHGDYSFNGRVTDF